MAKFEEVYAIDVNDKTEKKGGLTYLSWAWAWAEFKKKYPEATYQVQKFDGLPYVKDEKVGYMVYTTVTADGLTYEMWLPVMDSRNKAMLQPTMFDINKTIMRCLTKNLAMFGLGLYIYAGEDLPEDTASVTTPEPKPAKTARNAPETSKTTTVKETFKKLTKSELTSIYAVKNVEETIAWFEDKFETKFEEWDEDQTEAVRLKLQERKEKREQEKKEWASTEAPFPIE